MHACVFFNSVNVVYVSVGRIHRSRSLQCTTHLLTLNSAVEGLVACRTQRLVEVSNFYGFRVFKSGFYSFQLFRRQFVYGFVTFPLNSPSIFGVQGAIRIDVQPDA